MNQLLDQAILESEVLTDVKPWQIRIIFASAPSSLIAILLCSFILSVAQWDIADHFMIIFWFGLTNLLSLVGI